MTPDPAFLYMSGRHQEAVAGLAYAITSRKGFVALTGEAGTGKTTVLTKVLNHLPDRIRSSVIFNPTVTPNEFIELVLADFGMPDVSANKAQRILRLRRFLLETRAENKIAALVVDEAHKLSAEVLEEIRLLGNFERPDEKLLQIVLSGQPELNDLLNREDLRQFKQRIALRLAIEPLTPAEVEKCIAYRWSRAGATAPPPFEPAAVGRLAAVSCGIPRLLNAVCDNALMLAFSESAGIVTVNHVMEAARDLCLAEPPAAQPPAALPAPPPSPVIAEPPAYAQAPSFRLLERRPAKRPEPSLLARCTAKLGFNT